MTSSMIEPPIEVLLSKVDSKFELVTLAARRARNINSYFNQLGDGLGHMIPPQVSSVRRKPLSIAFEEIAAGKIVRAAFAQIFEELDLPEGVWPTELPAKALPAVLGFEEMLSQLEAKIDPSISGTRAQSRARTLSRALDDARGREFTSDELIELARDLQLA